MSEISESTHECVLCDAVVTSKEELREHFRKHANNEIDAKTLKSARKSTRKMSPSKGKIRPPIIHKLDSTIQCDFCNEQFTNVTKAIQHKFRKHPESVSKHFCPFCGMHFPLKYNCDIHMKQHETSNNSSTSQEFPCNDCNIVFYNQEAQKYHLKSTHERILTLSIATPPPSKKIRMTNAGDVQSVYYCHLCGLEYIIKFNLQKHLERQHSNEDREKIPIDLIKCITCDALFYNKQAYENHNIYHKPDDLYVTSEEQRLKTITKIDQDFDIRRVQTAAERYIPGYKRRRRRNSLQINKIELPKSTKTSDDELSPTSAPESSDSESELPLNQRLNILRKKLRK